MGCRGDWVLRSITNGDKDEFGMGELDLKSPKNPKDMLVKLMEKVSWNPTQCDKIQTIGIIHSGGFMIMVYLDRPKGYICRIKRSETMEVPDSPEKFPSILHIIN
ncbi:21975_t:CDS:2, partial [Entrophospora sp. SA101]